MNDLKARCAEEAVKVEKAREQRQKDVEEKKEAIETKMETAQANVEAQREAMISRLRKEVHVNRYSGFFIDFSYWVSDCRDFTFLISVKGERHDEVLQRQSEEFNERLRQLDTKYTDTDGKRNQVLMEMVDKLKEHVSRVL